MNLYVEYDAAALAELIGFRRPACDALIVRLRSPGEVLASVFRHNPLNSPWSWDPDAPGQYVVCWSGTLAADLFERHPMTWGIAGHQALRDLCERAAPAVQARGRSLCLRPHSRHVLSDPPSCLAFHQQFSGQGLRIALDAGAMLEPSMVPDADDYIARAFEALGPVCAMVMLADARLAADGESVVPAPLGDGLLQRELVLRLVAEHVPATTAIVLRPEKLQQQLQWLGT